MSTRERWIVYPLLFLALGAALRDKVIGKIEIPRFVCGRLDVRGLTRCEAVECGQSVCQELLVLGPTGQPVVVAGANSQAANSGIIKTLSSDGRPLVQINASRFGNGIAGQMLVLGDVGKGVRAPLAQFPPVFGIGPPHGPALGHEGPHSAPNKSNPRDQPPSGAQKQPGKPNPTVPTGVK